MHVMKQCVTHCSDAVHCYTFRLLCDIKAKNKLIAAFACVCFYKLCLLMKYISNKKYN